MSPEEGSPVTVSQMCLLESCVASVFFLGRWQSRELIVLVLPEIKFVQQVQNDHKVFACQKGQYDIYKSQRLSFIQGNKFHVGKQV